MTTLLAELSLAPLLPFIGGLIALLLARWWYRVLRRTARTTGSVVSVIGSATKRNPDRRGPGSYSTPCTATITFTVDGSIHHFDFSFLRGQENFVREQAVPVLYDPKNPRNASVDQGRANYTEVGFATIVFTVVAALPLLGC